MIKFCGSQVGPKVYENQDTVVTENGWMDGWMDG